MLPDFCSILSYNPDMGVLFWKVSQCNNKIPSGSVAGTLSKDTGYIVVKVGGRSYKAHRIAHFLMTGLWPERNPDHENRIRHDNRWSNIKDLSPGRSENGGNRNLGVNNTSGLKGVYWSREHNRWQAQIEVLGRNLYLGRFPDLHLAGLTYDAAAKLAWGLRFSCLNFPSEESDHIVLPERVTQWILGE
jgi:hypothetical protein